MGNTEELDGRVAIITGAARNIGWAIALDLADAAGSTRTSAPIAAPMS